MCYKVSFGPKVGGVEKMTAVKRSGQLRVTHIALMKVSRNEEYFRNKLRGKNPQKGKWLCETKGMKKWWWR